MKPKCAKIIPGKKGREHRRCSRSATSGVYCGQHHPSYQKMKNMRAELKWDEERRMRHPHEKLMEDKRRLGTVVMEVFGEQIHPAELRAILKAVRNSNVERAAQ